jgi:hypothetical protein
MKCAGDTKCFAPCKAAVDLAAIAVDPVAGDQRSCSGQVAVSGATVVAGIEEVTEEVETEEVEIAVAETVAVAGGIERSELNGQRITRRRALAPV